MFVPCRLVDYSNKNIMKEDNRMHKSCEKLDINQIWNIEWCFMARFIMQ